MKKIGIFFIFCLLSSYIAVAQNSHNKPRNKSTAVETVDLSDNGKIKNSSKFIDAVKERLLGNLDVAEILLREVINLEPKHDAAHFEYAQILASKHRIPEAIIELKKAIELNNENIWYKIMLGDIYNMTQNYSESEKLWKPIVEKYPDNIEYLYHYALSLIYQNKLKEALKVYDKMEIQTGVNEEIVSAKHSIWMHLKDTKNAAKELHRLIETYPYESKYYLQLADFYNVNDMSKKAIPYIVKAQEIDPDNPEINIILYNYYISNKKNKEAFEALRKVFAAPVLPIEEKVKIIMRYFPVISTNKLYKREAFILLDSMIIAHPDNPMAWSVYADFLSQDNQLEEAVSAFEKVIEYDKSKYVIWEQYLSILLELNQFEKAYQQSAIAMELFPTQALPYFVHGIVSVQKKDWQQAISTLEEGEKYIVDNEAMRLQIYFYLAEAYHNISDNEKSDDYFEKILLKEPNNTMLLNNYSYYLSVRSERLDYALNLAEKANKLDPHIALYEDTLGWIFFKKGNIEQAQLWLEKALSHGGDKEAEILEHYGDILHHKGEKTKALEYWNKAKEIGEDNPDLIKKIKAHIE